MSKTLAARKPEGMPARPNLSGIEPIEYKVLVLPPKDDGIITLKGGFKLHKPDETKERDQHAAMTGEIVAVSPLAFTYEEWPAGTRRPDVGDQVVFARYSGITITGNDGLEYRLMNDKDIVAVKR